MKGLFDERLVHIVYVQLPPRSEQYIYFMFYDALGLLVDLHNVHKNTAKYFLF